jgi:serine/threonine protein phosphatase 1
MTGRRLAIGDIHGCLRTLSAQLERFAPGPGDTVYLLGDYIDRGPSSKGVLELLLALVRDGIDLRPLRGNHEQLLLDAVGDADALAVWKGNGGYRTLQEFGVSHPGKIPSRYLDFLSSLPLVHLLDDYVLVHAGLDFDSADPLRESRPQHLLWTRDPQVDAAKLGGRTLVTGHTVTSISAIRQSLSTSHIRIDNGCFSRGELGYGALVALDLDARILIEIANCEKNR